MTGKYGNWRDLLVGASPAMLRTLDIVERVAARRATVLITGETGTGKEMVARAIHCASPRAAYPMVVVNAAALPENLIEAELFGHVRGAFTGAVQARIGRFEQAHRSTLFLDEIGDLPLEMQTKLLRFLQEREFQKVGSSETVRVDVRLIAATNVNLLEQVQAGKFREDLYYRLNVVPIHTPPLRERREDIPLLAQHFVEKVCAAEQIPVRRLTPEALARLQSLDWPGNVRQLENAIEMAVALCGDRMELTAADFGTAVQARSLPGPLRETPNPLTGLDFEQTISRLERQLLEDALRQTHGNKSAAAELLGLKRTTLNAKLKALGAAA
jgi:DNA-binding NtrC family response regulator